MPAKNSAVEVRRADPLAYRAALRAVGGDVHRLEVMLDGSVKILNKPRKRDEGAKRF